MNLPAGRSASGTRVSSGTMHSLIGSGDKVAVMNGTMDLRRRLGRLRRRLSGAEQEALLSQVAELAGEVSTLSARLEQPGGESPAHTDVAIVSDFRLPGGTTASIAEEVRAQSAAGVRTALIHAQSAVTSTSTGFSRHIRAVLGLPGVDVVSPRSALHANLLVIRHPKVIETAVAQFPGITAGHVVIVANHPALDADGTWQYGVLEAGAAAYEAFGVTPEWAPISPVVRASIQEQGEPPERLAQDDWVNIFGQEMTTTPRTGFVAEKPVIGRHSRPQKEKWPATAEALLGAYPDGGDYRVEILGGAEVPEKVLGAVPAGWQVQPFGSEEPADFLQRIDFWVFMHHPDWREAFGRAIMEALAAGCVAVLPQYLRQVFGDAALYAEPSQVLSVVDRYWDDQGAYLEQSRRGQQFAAEHGPAGHLQRLRQRGVSIP